MASENEDLGSNPKTKSDTLSNKVLITQRSDNIRSVLCATCLSNNRVLHPVAAIQDLVPLLNDVGLDLDDSICWECRALMDKFDKFKNRAKISISTLNSLVGNNNIPMTYIYNQVHSLSTLRQSTKKIYDAQFSFYIKEENIQFEGNEQSDIFGSLHTCEDIEPRHVKEEVYLIPSLQKESVPIENSNMQHLIETLVPILVPSADSKLTEPGSSLGISSQLPSTRRKDKSGSMSDDDNCEENVDKDDKEMPKKKIKTNKCKKHSRMFSNRDLITKILTEEEMLKYREEERAQTWFKNAKFRCMSCIQYFASKDALIKHNFLHCPIQQGKFACSICDLKFISQKAVVIHEQTHYRNYDCRYCSYSSYSQHRLITHWQRRHDLSANRQCIDCGVEFLTHRHLRYHRETAHSEKPQCVECGKIFVSSTNLKRHMLLHKGSMPEVECDICHKKYRGSWGLRAHMRTHDETQSENAYCTECDIQFKNIYLYRAHLKSNSRHVDPDTFKFQCSYCGKKFYCKTYLSNHIQTVHLKLNNYECEQCNHTFHNVAQLRRHQRDNHSGKPKTRNNICHLCGKAFTVKKSLNEHMNTHLGKRPFKCIECGATFAYSAALYTHTRLLHLKLKRGKKNSAASTVDQT